MKKRSVILTSGLLVLFVVVTVLVVLGVTKGFDEAVYSLVRSLESSFFDKYFIFITKLGNESTIIVLVILLLILFKSEQLLILFSALASVVSNQLIKHIIMRPRPDVLKLIEQGGYSFPSGHSMIAIAVYGLLLYFVNVKIKNKYLKYGLSFLLVLLILSIGISRIYVGVHYASDVFGGFLLATVELIALIALVKRRSRGNLNV